MLQRLDKRKDRVEISPEQLCNAAITAEISFSMLSNKYRALNKAPNKNEKTIISVKAVNLPLFLLNQFIFTLYKINCIKCKSFYKLFKM